MAQYNQYTPKMLAEFPDIKKGSGKSIKFRLTGVYVDKITGKFVCPTSSSVLPVDRINDEHGNSIDIAFIKGVRPTGPNAMRAEEVVLGEIEFQRGNMGMFEWFGEAETRELAKYLYFCNYNKSNIGKFWHIPPPTQSYVFEILGDEGAAQRLDRDRLVDRAKGVIEEIAADPASLDAVKRGMFPNDYSRYTDEQIILKLRDIAEKSPEKIVALKKGKSDMKVNAAINSFVKENLIVEDAGASAWKYPDGTLITNIGEEETAIQAIKRFFSTDDGEKAFEILVGQLKGKKK